MATDVSASFPDVVLAPGSTITVTMDDANAKVTKLNVYGVTPVAATVDDETVQTFVPMFTYGNG